MGFIGRVMAKACIEVSNMPKMRIGYIKAIIFLFEAEFKVALGHYTVTFKM